MREAELDSLALFQGSLYLAVGRLFSDLPPFVVLSLAARDGDLKLYVVVSGVEFQRDQGLSLFLVLAGETGDLPPVEQQLAVAGGELFRVRGVRVRRDVRRPIR